MSRERALDILKRAREMLAERLVEQVVASEEEIYAESIGLSYGGEIDALHDKFAAKLNHLNGLISALPPVNDSAGRESTSDDVSLESGDLNSPHARMPLALPAPLRGSLVALPSPVTSAPTFAPLMIRVQAGAMSLAAAFLVEMLGLPTHQAAACATVFARRWEQNGDLASRLVALPGHVRQNELNDALVAVWECFALSGLDALGALQTLRTRLK